MTDERFETRGVLCGAYQGRARRFSGASLLTHTVRVDGLYRAGTPLCKRVDPDNIADGYGPDDSDLHLPPTCPVCLRRDPRFKHTTPRTA